MCMLATLSFVVSAHSQSRWAWLISFHLDSEWEMRDPGYLYLSSTDQATGVSSITWLHPLRRRSALDMESFMPGEQQKARMFEFWLTSETPEGYEVSFQPLDPITEQPLPLRDRQILFIRGRETTYTLTDKITVFGFYGDPSRQPPQWWPMLYATKSYHAKAPRRSQRIRK